MLTQHQIDNNIIPDRNKKKLFINLSNHPSPKWSFDQITAVGNATIIDIEFPNIDPNWYTSDVYEKANTMATTIYNRIKKLGLTELNVTVLVQGEMTLTFALVTVLKSWGFDVVSATSERIVDDFHFIKFRRY